MIHAAVGELDTAFRHLERIDHWRAQWVARLRGDPRSEELIGESNQQWGLPKPGFRLPGPGRRLVVRSRSW